MERFDDLAIFVEVVDRGSLSLAADRLGLTPSAVSRRISQLEQRLGARLLSRSTRRVALTDAGATFCLRARAILTALDEAERSVSEIGQEPRGLLRISTPVLFGQMHLAPALPGFAARFPQVALDLNLDDRGATSTDAGFDVALRTGRLTDSTLIARRLAPLRSCVLASPGYLARKGTPLAPSDLSQHDCLAFASAGVRQDWDFTVGTTVEAIRIAAAIQGDDHAVLKILALADCGLARLPGFVAAAEIRAGALIPVLTEYEVTTDSVYLLYPPARQLAPKIRVFIDHLLATIGQAAYWDAAALACPTRR
ncbi:MAG: LysR family transcriptional regulator [Azospirillaceae bacterium]|nr:LysR family transcriptional regulator [Azospirillaceae bacterium]